MKGGGRTGRPPNPRKPDWFVYVRCEECGCDARAACRTMEDTIADQPCTGRGFRLRVLDGGRQKTKKHVRDA